MPNVLIIDDSPTDIRLMCELLSAAGYQICAAASAAEGMEILGTAAFDVILMDMNMPEVNGYEATRQLRQAGRTLPIIAVTAYDDEDDQRLCISAGCNAYVAKQQLRTQLVDTLQQQLS